MVVERDAVLDGAGVEEALRVELAVEDLVGGWGVGGKSCGAFVAAVEAGVAEETVEVA